MTIDLTTTHFTTELLGTPTPSRTDEVGTASPTGRVLHERGPDGGRTLADVEHRLDIPLAHAMETQRAIRRVEPDPVDPALIDRLIELALKGPTAGNEQGWRFLVVTDPTTKRAIGDRYRAGWGPYRRQLLRKHPDDPAMDRMIAAVQWQVDHFDEVPAVIVPCLEGGRVPGLPVPFIARTSYFGSVYPAVQNLLLSARAVGLGANLVTGPLFPLGRLRRALGLPRSVTPICVVPVGWPVGRYGPTTRRPVSEVVHHDRWTG